MLRYGVEMRDKAIWYLPQGRKELVGLSSQAELAAYSVSATKFHARKHHASITEVKSYLRTSLPAELHLSFRSLEGWLELSIFMFLNYYFRRKINRRKWKAVFIDSIYNLQTKPGKDMQISATELLHDSTNTASSTLISLCTISRGKPSCTSWLWDRNWKLVRGHRPCGKTGVVKLWLPVPQVHELICCDTLESHRFKGKHIK